MGEIQQPVNTQMSEHGLILFTGIARSFKIDRSHHIKPPRLGGSSMKVVLRVAVACTYLCATAYASAQASSPTQLPPVEQARAAPTLQEVVPPGFTQLDQIEAMLQKSDEEIDLAKFKLAIDKMIDPATDEAAVLKQLDSMAAEIRATFPVVASNLVKFKALRDYLYRPSPESGRQPYVYNLEDDRNPRAKLLSVYLATHKGNCISMPLLFVILGQKLGIPVTITTVPSHVYVKFRGDNGNWYGVETTSGGGWADDDWQKKQFPRLTETAITNGIYLQPLTKKEAAVVIADSLLEYYENQHSVEANSARIKLALLQIRHYPKNVVAMVHVYLGYRELRQKLFVEKYPQPSDIPRDLWPQYVQIENDSMYWGAKAKALGYQPSTPAMDAAYRERIQRARASIETQ